MNLKFLLQLGLMNLICLMETRRNIIIKKHETLTENPPVKIHLNKIKNRIVFKVKTGYKLELLSPEMMKLLGGTKKD